MGDVGIRVAETLVRPPGQEARDLRIPGIPVEDRTGIVPCDRTEHVPGGTLYLTWRVTKNSDRRDEHGRFYAVFDPALVSRAMGSADILLDEERDSGSSGKLVRRVIAPKATPAAA